MNKAILFFITILSYCQVFAQQLEVVNLQCEYHSNPLGIENPRPQLCWQLNASQRNVMQTGYRILVSNGYGYQLAHGATALTESWQAYRLFSNNHFMFGHLVAWFYSGLGGIKPSKNSVAFKKIDIRPEPVGDVTFASANYLSPYSKISSAWKKNSEGFELNVEIPANTTATIYLPAKGDVEITESGQLVTHTTNVRFLRCEQAKDLIAVGSGHFVFKVKQVGN